MIKVIITPVILQLTNLLKNNRFLKIENLPLKLIPYLNFKRGYVLG